jgi:hypothetical protein
MYHTYPYNPQVPPIWVTMNTCKEKKVNQTTVTYFITVSANYASQYTSQNVKISFPITFPPSHIKSCQCKPESNVSINDGIVAWKPPHLRGGSSFQTYVTVTIVPREVPMKSYVGEIPTEIINEIFFYLDYRSLLEASITCK